MWRLSWLRQFKVSKNVTRAILKLVFKCFAYGSPLFFWSYYINKHSLSSWRAFTWSKSTVEIPEQCVNYVQSKQWRHQNGVIDVIDWGSFESCFASETNGQPGGGVCLRVTLGYEETMAYKNSRLKLDIF